MLFVGSLRATVWPILFDLDCILWPTILLTLYFVAPSDVGTTNQTKQQHFTHFEIIVTSIGWSPTDWIGLLRLAHFVVVTDASLGTSIVPLKARRLRRRFPSPCPSHHRCRLHSLPIPFDTNRPGATNTRSESRPEREHGNTLWQ